MNLYADLAAIKHTRGAANIMGSLNLLKFLVIYQFKPIPTADQINFISMTSKLNQYTPFKSGDSDFNICIGETLMIIIAWHKYTAAEMVW